MSPAISGVADSRPKRENKRTQAVQFPYFGKKKNKLVPKMHSVVLAGSGGGGNNTNNGGGGGGGGGSQRRRNGGGGSGRRSLKPLVVRSIIFGGNRLFKSAIKFSQEGNV